MLTIERGTWGLKSFATRDEFEAHLKALAEFYAPLRQFMPNSHSPIQQIDQALQYFHTGRNQPDQAVQCEQHALNSAQQIHSQSYGLVPHDTADGELIDSFRPNFELAGKVAAQLSAPPNSTTEHQAAPIVTAYRYPNMTGSKGFSFANTIAAKVKAFEAEVARSEGVCYRRPKTEPLIEVMPIEY